MMWMWIGLIVVAVVAIKVIRDAQVDDKARKSPRKYAKDAAAKQAAAVKKTTRKAR